MRHPGVNSTEFAAFYGESKDRCLRAVVASGLRPDQAEEAVAEAFARAWASWRTVRKARSPAAWVVRTAVNADISWWRRRRRESPSAEPPDRRLHPDPSTSDSMSADLLAAIGTLPARQREVVVLRYLLDLDTATTAAWLGIAPGTVGAHLHHALHALRDHLTQPEGIDR